jgi:hypothetical protein
MNASDLLGNPSVVGLTVRLGRNIDREKPCCSNLARIHPGKGPHAGELFCLDCGVHRGWLSKVALDFLTQTAARFGAPSEPITLRDSTFGDQIMTKFDDNNRGVLFRENKEPGDEKGRDYSGSLNVEGTEFWLSGWAKVSKKGTRFLSLSLKPKNEPTQDNGKPKQSVAAELNDEIPF